jgi:hypothetical protein
MDEQAEKDPKEEIFFFIVTLFHFQIFENLSKILKILVLRVALYKLGPML